MKTKWRKTHSLLRLDLGTACQRGWCTPGRLGAEHTQSWEGPPLDTGQCKDGQSQERHHHCPRVSTAASCRRGSTFTPHGFWDTAFISGRSSLGDGGTASEGGLFLKPWHPEQQGCPWGSLDRSQGRTWWGCCQETCALDPGHSRGAVSLILIMTVHESLKFIYLYLKIVHGFPGGSEGKASACNAGDLDLIPGSGKSLGEGNASQPQYPCLENPMDRGAWWATVHGVVKSRTRLSGTRLMLQKVCALDPGHSRGAVSLILITTVHESLKFISLYLKIVYRRRYITQGT